ncbi:hypothetical protein HZB01_03805 [Candidatus Woesearchaeota archaeon]|nr:hypothetical protein [Candidatus Woesearchaeota archaeon]
MAELDNIKDLPAKERVAKLKELEQKKKDELKSVEQMIRESQSEAEHDQEVAEIDIDIPQATPIDITSLFDTETTGIEKEADDDKGPLITAYTIHKDYEALGDLRNTSAYQHSLSSTQIEQLQEIDKRLSVVDYNLLTKDLANKLVASRSLLYDIKRYTMRHV